MWIGIVHAKALSEQFRLHSNDYLERIFFKVVNLPQPLTTTVIQRWEMNSKRTWRINSHPCNITLLKRLELNDHSQVGSMTLIPYQYKWKWIVSGKYNKFYETGTYVCVVCHQELFGSDTKYDSGCGWPAFYDVLEKGRVTLHNDPSLGNYYLFLVMFVITNLFVSVE